MSDIFVQQPDAISLIIQCSDSIAYELNDFFTFEAPNAKFSPAYKAKRWDGKTRLFSLQTKKLPVGLLKKLIVFSESRKYSIDFAADVLFPDEKKSPEEIYSYIYDTLDVHSNNIKIEPKEHQIKAVRETISKKRCLIISPTSSGKSLMIYSVIRKLLDENYKRKILIIVPTVNLVNQLYSDFEDYASNTTWSVCDWCSKIYYGQDKNPNENIIISTWQSLVTLNKSTFKKFDCVIVDECHKADAKSIRFILNNMPDTYHRLGFTATLKDCDVHHFVLEGMFGEPKECAETKELIDKGDITPLKINAIILKHNESDRQKCKNLSYQEEIDFLISHDKRNRFICNLALDTKNNTLILFRYVDKHGLILYNRIRESISGNVRKVFFISGNTDAEQRENIRKITEKETNAILVASFGVFSTGVNIKNLHNVIFASPIKGEIITKQSIGRQLRKHESKEYATLYDICDDLSLNNKPNFAMKHFLERLEIYTKEQHPYKIINLDL